MEQFWDNEDNKRLSWSIVAMRSYYKTIIPILLVLSYASDAQAQQPDLRDLNNCSVLIYHAEQGGNLSRSVPAVLMNALEQARNYNTLSDLNAGIAEDKVRGPYPYMSESELDKAAQAILSICKKNPNSSVGSAALYVYRYMFEHNQIVIGPNSYQTRAQFQEREDSQQRQAEQHMDEAQRKYRASRPARPTDPVDGILRMFR